MAACQTGQAGGAASNEFPPVVVRAVTVAPAEIPRMLPAVGTIESPQDTEIAAEVEGKIVFLDIPEGEEVEAGYILARVDDRRAHAAVSVDEARYRNAKDTFDRLESLHAAEVVSKQELDDATQELDQAKGELDDARTTLRKTAIRAPFTGALGLCQVSLGTYVSDGDPVVQITQTHPLDLIFSLPQRNVAAAAIGQPVYGVAGACTERFTAGITVVDPSLDPATRAVRIEARVPNDTGRLRPGMSATVQVQVGMVDGITIPQEAVVRRGTKRFAYTLGEGGVVAQNEITLGEYFANQLQVTSGLTPGEVVVVSGQQKLRPGAIAIPEPYEPIENPHLDLGMQAAAGDCSF